MVIACCCGRCWLIGEWNVRRITWCAAPSTINQLSDSEGWTKFRFCRQFVSLLIVALRFRGLFRVSRELKVRWVRDMYNNFSLTRYTRYYVGEYLTLRCRVVSSIEGSCEPRWFITWASSKTQKASEGKGFRIAAKRERCSKQLVRRALQ